MTKIYPVSPKGNSENELQHSLDTHVDHQRNSPLRILNYTEDAKENIAQKSSFLHEDYSSFQDYPSGSNLQSQELAAISYHKSSKRKSSMKHHSSHTHSNPNISIKTCLILLVAFLEILTVVILSSIWISCFLPSMLRWGSSLREKGFESILQFTQSTLKGLILVTETQREILSNGFDPYDTELVEKHMFKLFKNELIRHPSLPITIYLGDHTRYNYGVMKMDEDTLAVFNIDSYYFCQNYLETEYCVRNSTPDEVLGEFDMTPIWETASQAPGGTRFTLSYSDISMESITFITLLSMVNNLTDPSNYRFWIGYDVSVESFSKYLSTATKEIPGAIAFTIEVETNYLISNYDPSVSVASWDENEEETRMTALTVDDHGTNLIAGHVYKLYPKLEDIDCNQKILLEVDEYYLSMYRLCTEENIDWLIVFAEPTINYSETIFVAIGAALGSSLVIIVVSIVFGVFVSFKIIQPFYELIFNFSEVSEMKLEGLLFQKSVFREAQILQGHFKGMVDRIKLYRCFIPSHLISKLDGNEGEETEKSRKSKESQSKNETSFAKAKLESSDSFNSTISIKRTHVDNMAKFSLHLESRRVAFVCLHIEGMGLFISTCPHTETVNILSEIFKYVYDLSKVNGGSVGNFESETIMISFNSNIDTSSPEKKGIVFASQIVKKLNGMGALKRAISGRETEKPLGFRAAVLSQYCCCGNLGTNEFKNFTIIGSFKQNLMSMIGLALRLNIELVVTEEIKTRTSTLFQHRYIDTLQFLTETHYGLPEFDKTTVKTWAFSQVLEYGNLNISMETANNSFLKQSTEVNIYEYGEFLDVKYDEWMYELEEKKRRNEWNSYINATNLFWDKKNEDAIIILNEYLDRSLEKGKTDLPTINLLEKIKKQIEKEQYGD